MKKRLRNEPFFLFIIYLHHICYKCYNLLVMIHDNTKTQELKMKKVNLNNWEVEVKESKNGTQRVMMWFGSKPIFVNLHTDGTSSIDVTSFRCDGAHARVSNKTKKVQLTSGKKITLKKTVIASHDTDITFSKFSE